MPSEYYNTSIEQGKSYQLLKKGWGGNDSKKYHLHIADLVSKYQAHTMLDYGCGRGEQYTIPVPWPTPEFNVFTDAMTLDQRIGIESYFMYDPCVPGIDQLPVAGSKFDCVICTQVVGSIPDDDMSWVVELLMSYTTKFCFIGLLDPLTTPVKSKKQELYDKQFFSVQRTQQWYWDQFKDWRGSDLYIYFKGPNSYQGDWHVGKSYRSDY